MKIENWYLTNSIEGGLALPRDFKTRSFYITGKIYGKKGVEDGKLITTNLLLYFYDNEAITKDGIVYELGEMNEDYIKFIDAYNNIKVIKEWKFEKGYISGYVFEEGKYNSDNVLCSKIVGDIISQNLEENICEIETVKGKCEVFVDWQSISDEQKEKIKLWPIDTQNNFKEFSHKKVMLDIFSIYSKTVKS